MTTAKRTRIAIADRVNQAKVMQRYGVHAPADALAEVAARMPARNGGTS